VFIYITISICTVFLSLIAAKYKSKVILFVLIAFLTVISGTRSVNVGTDTSTYYAYFEQIACGNSGYFDVGFELLSKVLIKLLGEVSLLFITYAAITNCLIVLRLWKLRRKPLTFTLMIFIYVAMYYAESMNIMKQFLALSIVFYSTSLLKNKRYLTYIIMVIIASTIHMSAAISIVILPIYFFNNDENKRKHKYFFLMAVLCIPFIIGSMISIFDTYKEFFLYSKVVISYVIIFRLFIVFTYLTRNHRVLFLKNVSPEEKELKIDFFIFAVGAMISIIGLYYEQMARIALYFTIFEIPFLSQIVTSKRNKWVVVLYIIMALYFIIVKISINHEYQIIPYSSFFLK